MGPDTEDTREEFAAQLEWLASQVRKHGVLSGWEIDASAETMEVPSGRFINHEPTGRCSYRVKFDVNRSQAWRNEAQARTDGVNT